MTDVSPIDPRLHVELWTSWASLLRSYAGAHGLSSPHHAVVEVGPEEIILRVDTRWLRFTHTGLTSSEGRQTPFQLEENGTATFDDANEDMDLLAERLAREMMSQ
jgi:hypothetical protein